MNSIDVTGLTCDYGHGHGIFDLTFSVNAGEVFGFLGPNASGKTTTIRHLMGFARPASGSCQIEGRDCFTSASVIQQTLGYLPGDIALFPEMSGKAFVSFLARYRGMKNRGRVKKLTALNWISNSRFAACPRATAKSSRWSAHLCTTRALLF